MRTLLLTILFSFIFSFSKSPISLVTKVKGDVKYRKNDKANALSAIKRSNSLFNQDQILTGDNGFTKFVYLDDGTTIKIHKNSDVFIQGNPKKEILSSK